MGMYDRRMVDVFRISLPAPTGTRIDVRVLGYGMDLGPRVVNPNGIEDWFLFHFHSPIERHFPDGRVQHLPAHSAVVHAPFQALHYEAPDGTVRRSWMRFRGTAVAQVVADAGVPTDTLMPLADGEQTLRWLWALRDECDHPRGADPDTIDKLAAIWLRSLARAGSAARLRLPRGDHVLPERVRRVRRHIEEHALAAPTLDDLAAVAECSRSQLCRDFRRHLGISPQRYQTRVRVDHAAELLRSTDLDLDAIAERCGFCDRYHFSRVFARETDHPPARYREIGRH